MRWIVLIAVMGLAACDLPASTSDVKPNLMPTAVPEKVSVNVAARNFLMVVKAVEPVAERECRKHGSIANCDFKIVVDDRPSQPINAYQTVDKNGQPIIAFTLALISEARNADEIAFVMGHEAAHHIKGHLTRQRENAAAGAVIFAGLAALTGGDVNAVKSAQEFGAAVGARSYSKDYELEADALGTLITMRSGFDAIKGAQFFARIPDPGDKFLGTHPPNSKRAETVRRVALGGT